MCAFIYIFVCMAEYICGPWNPGCADRERPRCCSVFVASVGRKGAGIEGWRERGEGGSHWGRGGLEGGQKAHDLGPGTRDLHTLPGDSLRLYLSLLSLSSFLLTLVLVPSSSHRTGEAHFWLRRCFNLTVAIRDSTDPELTIGIGLEEKEQIQCDSVCVSSLK